MSIATKKGDSGSTALMYNRRVSKTNPRVEACGAIDELNAALGLARAASPDPFSTQSLLLIQKDLVVLMGELATLPEDLPRFQQDGFHTVDGEMIARLDRLVAELESRKISFAGWATPGNTPSAGFLDFARTVCRRAERNIVQLHERNLLPNAEIIVFLNRLSDVLWLLARWNEPPEKSG